MYVYTIAFAAAVTDSGFYAEIQINFGTVWRFRLFLEHCGDLHYFWDRVEIHVIFLRLCEYSNYFWDSVEIHIIFGTVWRFIFFWDSVKIHIFFGTVWRLRFFFRGSVEI